MDESMQKELLLSDADREKDRDVEEVLAEGSHLYRQHCLYCHGLSGDASGPTGQFLNPLPRDFRQGKFKFRSTAKKSGEGFDTSLLSLPSRADLKKTIRHGVPTASMPSFTLLAEDALDALVSYVIHLSLRGQVEYQLALAGSAEGANVDEELARVAKKWVEDNKTLYVPPEAPKGLSWITPENAAESWQRGRKAYADAGCYQCHGQDGRASVAEVAENETRMNDWGDLIAPRNLTLGIFRGGSRPIDIYYRIKLGIPVSAMPAANPQQVKDEEIWHLVDYVMSMPRLPSGGSKSVAAGDVGGLSK
jgi:mono/diheme cytochrome c family protein